MYAVATGKTGEYLPTLAVMGALYLPTVNMAVMLTLGLLLGVVVSGSKGCLSSKGFAGGDQDCDQGRPTAVIEKEMSDGVSGKFQ